MNGPEQPLRGGTYGDIARCAHDIVWNVDMANQIIGTRAMVLVISHLSCQQQTTMQACAFVSNVSWPSSTVVCNDDQDMQCNAIAMIIK